MLILNTILLTSLQLLVLVQTSNTPDNESTNTIEFVLVDKKENSEPNVKENKNEKIQMIKGMIEKLVKQFMTVEKENKLVNKENDRAPTIQQQTDIMRKSNLKLTNQNFSTPKVDNDRLKRVAKITPGYSLFCKIQQNLGVIKDRFKNKKELGKIGKILVYKNGDVFTDYWGKLNFKLVNNTLIDDTGYFEGELVKDFNDILNQGKLTETGYFQNKSIEDKEVENHILTMKLFIDELAILRNIDIDSLMREPCNLSSVEELIFYKNSSNTSKVETVNVCVCTDSFCKEPCKEILVVEKRYLK